MVEESESDASHRNSRNSIPIGGPLDDRRNVKQSPKPIEELPPEIQQILIDRKKLKTSEKKAIDSLEGKYVLTLILYLDKMSPVLKSDIYNDISRGAGMVEKLNDLQRLGIIEIYHTARTVSNVIVITDKGRKIAAIINEMLETLSE